MAAGKNFQGKVLKVLFIEFFVNDQCVFSKMAYRVILPAHNQYWKGLSVGQQTFSFSGGNDSFQQVPVKSVGIIESAVRIFFVGIDLLPVGRNPLKQGGGVVEMPVEAAIKYPVEPPALFVCALKEDF